MLLKHDYELTLQDFEQYPIWYFPDYEVVELYDDDADESTVTPFLNDGPLDKMSIVKAVFTDQAGVKHPGYIRLEYTDHVGYLHPTLCINGENTEVVTFWDGPIIPVDQEMPEYYSKLKGKFPIKFETVPSIHYVPVTGILEGIYYYDENKEVQVYKL